MKFGEQVRIMRSIRNLTQRQLGDKVGCSNTIIHLIETDQHQPDDSLVTAIRQALGDFDESILEKLK